jgi:hypothetical protein
VQLKPWMPGLTRSVERSLNQPVSQDDVKDVQGQEPRSSTLWPGVVIISTRYPPETMLDGRL